MFDDESLIIVHVGYAWQGQDGWTFVLSPWTKHRLGESETPRATKVFVGNADASDTDPRRYAHIDDGTETEVKWGRWRIIASMLTGIPVKDLGTCMFRRMPEDTLLETVSPEESAMA